MSGFYKSVAYVVLVSAVMIQYLGNYRKIPSEDIKVEMEWIYFENLWYHPIALLFNLYFLFGPVPKTGNVSLSGINLDIVVLPFVKFNRFWAFTTWCWILQTIYFTFKVLYNFGFRNQLVAEVCLVALELGFSFALLVTFITNFILIPYALKFKHETVVFFNITALAKHNLNLILMVVEILLIRAKFQFSHLPLAALFGNLYVVWSWILASRRGFFLYFFINYNSPRILLMYVALTATLITFFAVAVLISHYVDPIEHFFAAPVSFLATWSVTRFKP